MKLVEDIREEVHHKGTKGRKERAQRRKREGKRLRIKV
jgi:hypothetical protein